MLRPNQREQQNKESQKDARSKRMVSIARKGANLYFRVLTLGSFGYLSSASFSISVLELAAWRICYVRIVELRAGHPLFVAVVKRVHKSVSHVCRLEMYHQSVLGVSHKSVLLIWLNIF